MSSVEKQIIQLHMLSSQIQQLNYLMHSVNLERMLCSLAVLISYSSRFLRNNIDLTFFEEGLLMRKDF